MSQPTRAGLDLSREEISQFRQQGFLGPYPLCPPEEMVPIRTQMEAVLGEPPYSAKQVHNRHLDSRAVYDLSTHPAIVERMACLYGPDLLLWRTNFFVKEPGAKEIPWHQDFNYWPLEPPIIASAWIAIDPATKANSCLQVLPGSHRKIVPHIKAGEEMVFAEQGDDAYFDVAGAIDVEMEPGQFILFNERTLHHSEANRSNQRRIGLAVRVIIPLVEMLKPDSPNHGLVLIRGKDPMGFNHLTTPPAAPHQK